jgi:hypothetical protein
VDQQVRLSVPPAGGVDGHEVHDRELRLIGRQVKVDQRGDVARDGLSLVLLEECHGPQPVTHPFIGGVGRREPPVVQPVALPSTQPPPQLVRTDPGLEGSSQGEDGVAGDE